MSSDVEVFKSMHVAIRLSVPQMRKSRGFLFGGIHDRVGMIKEKEGISEKKDIYNLRKICYIMR